MKIFLPLLIQFFILSCQKKTKSCDSNECDPASSSEISSSATSNDSDEDESSPISLTAPSDFTHLTQFHDVNDSPTFSWTAVDGASKYQIAVGSTKGGIDILGWTDVGNVNQYYIQSLTLNISQTYFPSVRAVDINGTLGPSAESNGWVVSMCPTGYILIPGNSSVGLGGTEYSEGTKSFYDWDIHPTSATSRSSADFCVMKYEAKQGDDWKAISIAEGIPWENIGREIAGADNDAQEACENNGSNFYLIGNNHWQAIARNIESEPENYDTSGASADYMFNRGHGDDSFQELGSLAADVDDSNGCAGLGNKTYNDTLIGSDCGGVWHRNKRTHKLTNGEVIWDISANSAEYIRDIISGAQGAANSVQAEPWSSQIKWGPSNSYAAQTGAEKAGLGYSNLSGSAGAAYRGGISWGIVGSNNGMFSADTTVPPSTATLGLGFRCVFLRP